MGVAPVAVWRCEEVEEYQVDPVTRTHGFDLPVATGGCVRLPLKGGGDVLAMN